MKKKRLALLMVMVLFVMSALPAFAAETERFLLIPGVYWGDSVDNVIKLCGRPDQRSSISVVETLAYNNIEFAGRDYCSLGFTFTNDKLTKMYLLIFEFENIDMLYDGIKKVFEDEYGKALQTNESEIRNRTFAEDINGNFDFWYVADDTIMYIECQKQTITIHFMYMETQVQE